VIWGLDSEEHHAGEFGSDSQMKKQEITAQPSQPVRNSPRHYKFSNESAVASTKSHSSVANMLSPRRAGPGGTSYNTLKQATSVDRADVIYSCNPYNETIVLENLIDRRAAMVAHRDHDYDAMGDLTRTLKQNLHLRDPETELQNNGELDCNLLSRGVYGSRNPLSSSRSSLPAMRVSSRPAVGSALPQILIEPRSPEVPQVPSRRMTAMELSHQYQQHQLLKMQQQSLLPTPPNSSSPLWSSEFSPYNHHSPSPASLKRPVVREHLRDTEVSEQLRYLMQERLARNIVHEFDVSPLAPPAQINSVSRLDYPDYELDPVTSQALTNLLATQDFQHLPSLPSEVLLPTRAQMLPGYLANDVRRYSAPHHDTLLSPASPEELGHTRGHSQHQIPRSIPLARLMQRRLSSVPEEDSSPTIHGRSPSPPQVMRHGTDKSYLHPHAQHGYRYADMLEPSASYSSPYLESAPRGSQGKARGSIFGSRNSTVGTDVLEAQGRYRPRRDGGSSERESSTAPRRAGGLRKTRGRPPRFHAN
jgi:hypothetical protein